MKFVFISPSGQRLQTAEASMPPPAVAPSKGRWLGLVEGAIPTHDPDTHYLATAGEVVGDEYHVTWQRFPIAPEEREKVRKAKRFVADRQNLLDSAELQSLLVENLNEIEIRLRNATVSDLAAEVKRLAKIVNILLRQQYENQ